MSFGAAAAAADRPSDEDILAFEQRVKDEQSLSVPLVGEREGLQGLREEYLRGSSVYLHKITELEKTYSGMRRARGDGNCFFRAFAFAWYEHVCKHPGLAATFSPVFGGSNALFVSADFDPTALADFTEAAADLFRALPSSTTPPSHLHASFNDAMISNSVVTYLRFLASAYLRTHAADYAPFVEDMDLARYCSHHVEAFGRESDEVEIGALGRVTGVGIEVVYLDGRGGNDAVSAVHRFAGNEEGGSGVWLTLLYRPGHYDILYRKES